MNQNIETYIQEGGIRCPSCYSNEIQGDQLSIEAGKASQTMFCLSCHATWIDIYILNNIIDFQPNKKNN